MEHMEYKMPAECLRDLFYRQVEKSNALKDDVAHYRREMRKGPGTPDYTLLFLRQSVERYIEHVRHEQNLQDRKVAYQRNQPQHIPDNPATPAAGSKGKNKGKSKGNKDRSPSPTGSDRRGSSPTGSSGHVQIKKCYFHNVGLRGGSGCSHGDKCKFVHQRMSDDEFKKVQVPARSASPGGKGRRDGSPDAKGKGKKGARARTPGPKSYCHAFAKTGKCPREDKFGAGKCIFPHKTMAQVEADKSRSSR